MGPRRAILGLYRAVPAMRSTRKRRESFRNKQKAVAYVRLSPGWSAKDDDRLGIDAQREDIRAWATREGVELVGWFQDINVSGDVPPEDRPGLLDAFTALGEQDAGVLVVARRDRLSREVERGAVIRLMIRQHGATLRSADGKSDDDSPTGKAMQGMIDVFSELERAMIIARTRAALAAKKRRGEMIGSLPYGQRGVPDGARTNRAGRPVLRLVPDEDEQRVIKRAVELSASGKSLRCVARALYDEGFRSRGGGAFDHKQVSNMLARSS